MAIVGAMVLRGELVGRWHNGDVGDLGSGTVGSVAADRGCGGQVWQPPGVHVAMAVSTVHAAI